MRARVRARVMAMLCDLRGEDRLFPFQFPHLRAAPDREQVTRTCASSMRPWRVRGRMGLKHCRSP